MFSKFKGAATGSLLALALVSAVGFGGRVSAQDSTPVAASANASPAVISVTGTGSVTVTPDAASVAVGVTSTNASLSEAQSAATTQMTAVLDALKAAGIEEKDIQTSNYSVNILQDYDNNGNPTQITGYQVSNQVNVTIRDLAKLGDILDQAVGAGANSIYGITFLVTNSTDAEKQARVAAVQDAIDRAGQLASAAGGSLGAILSIDESSNGYNYPIPYAANAADGAGGSAVPIQAGGNVVTVQVSISFAMNQ